MKDKLRIRMSEAGAEWEKPGAKRRRSYEDDENILESARQRKLLKKRAPSGWVKNNCCAIIDTFEKNPDFMLNAPNAPEHCNLTGLSKQIWDKYQDNKQTENDFHNKVLAWKGILELIPKVRAAVRKHDAL